jgi:hypothetical protein
VTIAPAYLITGADGVSRLVVERLLAHGQTVRAMIHRDDALRF